MKTLVKSHQDNVEVIWRFARASYYHAEAQSDKNFRRIIILEGIYKIFFYIFVSACYDKNKLYLIGIQECERTIENRNSDLYKWYAILIGLNGDYLSMADQIKNGVIFKNYIIMALEICPDDSELHYLLGRFKYEIANLSWIEKKVNFKFYFNILINFNITKYYFMQNYNL